MDDAQERIEVGQVTCRWVGLALHMLVMRGAADYLTTSRVRSLGSEELPAEITNPSVASLADSQP